MPIEGLRRAAALLTIAAALHSAAAATDNFDSIAQRAAACSVCHGLEGVTTREGYFPRIAGKPAGYLYNQLVNFREGRRSSAAMTTMVDHLSDAYLRELADYFGGLDWPYKLPGDVSVPPEALMQRGEQLVRQGDPARGLPACSACHGEALTGVQPAMPGLLGLPRDYLTAQIGAWQAKQRRAAHPDCMATVAARLRADDVAAVTTWLARQRVIDAKPAAQFAAELPLPCGGMRPGTP